MLRTYSSTYYYLGIMIDNKMNWTQHINYLNAKLCKRSWAILKLKKCVNIHTSKTICYSLIYSHLKYSITSRGKATKTIIQPIIQGGDFKLLSSYIHSIFYFTFQIT